MTARPSISKRLEIDDLAAAVAAQRAAGRIVVHCHGVFDLLHIGHLRYLKGAKALGDVLVVTLTPDRFVDKGPFRPAFDEDLRLEAMAALEAVDYVALNRWPTAEETLRLVRPDVYAKGAEFQAAGADPTGKMELERAVAAEVGCEVAFIDDVVYSSSQLINRHLPIYPEAVTRYLDAQRAEVPLENVLELLDGLKDLRVLVVGDVILDEYVYVETLGKASKDPALAVRHLSEERFAGGAAAVANHLAAFGARVDLISVVGDDANGHSGDGADFLRDHLAASVTAHFVRRRGASTVRKRRFVDAYASNKLLSVYTMETAPAGEEVVAELRGAVDGVATSVDLVVCADYGHGAVPTTLVSHLASLDAFLAVNTQANAGNRGFHTVTRYPRADLVCLAEHEIRLETRDSEGALRPMMSELAEALGTSLFIVTRGKRGSLALGGGDFHEAPALASKIVDRVGAGDAFFALAALAARAGASPALVSMLGNAAGAQGVEIVGNRRSIDAARLRKQLTAMLK
ncbi:MAG: PfkB family carbohydrate kinase [Acidobacteriota bacterium]